ncbi:hypothetical protein ACF05T_07455 [Streptomyces lateritius]|uniref:Uncharacterized protein n=1 Tax=Streptomyces lateritius TaxID=67313 RepID=A0ABW6Y800_9ACTN
MTVKPPGTRGVPHFGAREKYVAITDDAGDRMNVLVHRRGADVPRPRRLVRVITVSRPGASTPTTP